MDLLARGLRLQDWGPDDMARPPDAEYQPEYVPQVP